MGIEIFLCEKTREGFRPAGEARHFASVGAFYTLAKLLGHMVEPLETCPVPQFQLGVGAWKIYVEERRAEGEERFAHYCRFSTNFANQLEAGGAEIPGDQLASLRVSSEDFHPLIRAYLGRLILSDEAVDPESAPVVGVVARMFSAMAEMMEIEIFKNQPETAEAFAFAKQKMNLICDACAEAAERSLWVVFDH